MNSSSSLGIAGAAGTVILPSVCDILGSKIRNNTSQSAPPSSGDEQVTWADEGNECGGREKPTAVSAFSVALRPASLASEDVVSSWPRYRCCGDGMSAELVSVVCKTGCSGFWKMVPSPNPASVESVDVMGEAKA